MLICMGETLDFALYGRAVAGPAHLLLDVDVEVQRVADDLVPGLARVRQVARNLVVLYHGTVRSVHIGSPV